MNNQPVVAEDSSQQKHILVIDDDQIFLTTLSDILSKEFKVSSCNSSKVARDLISLNQYDLVLTDVQMPHISGTDLLSWIKKNHPTKVILMTGFGKILETQEAYELGADGFIVKPFRKDDLFSGIRNIFGKSSPEANKTPPKSSDLASQGADQEDIDKQYCKLSIEDFVAQKEIDYPIYIKLGNKHYVKISHKGGKIPEDRIEIYKSKGIKHLYIRQEDFYKLIGFTMLVSKAVAVSGQVDKLKKQRFLAYTGELVVQQAFVAGVDKKAFDNAKDFLLTSVNILSEDLETFTLLDSLSGHADWLYSHSLGVSVMSLIIARQMGFQSPQTLFKLSFVGLFHDIGKKEISREILEKSRTQLNSEEIRLLETHSTRSRDILAALKTAPSDVIQIAYEHHEDQVGQGYPRRPPADKLHPLSPLVQMADIFTLHTLKSPQFPIPKHAIDAVKYIEMLYSEQVDKKAFNALKEVVCKTN